MAKKYAQDLTAGENVITHNLGTKDVLVQVFNPNNGDSAMVDVFRTDENSISINMGNIEGTYRVVIIG